jgi:NTE family protein
MPYHGPADGVFEGGGVKGIALVGALEIAEQHVTRWESLAGTSGGAIVAALLAAGYRPNEILGFLAGDGVPGLEGKFRLADLPRRRALGGIKGISEAVNLLSYLGLYNGDFFEEVMTAVLAAGPTPITTFGPLRADEADIAAGHPPYKLQFIATDLTHKRALIIPQDLEDPDSISVARGVRMSMSIPFFFEPVVLDTEPPTVIVDGGLLSNFPIWIFDSTHEAAWPTFGFLLDEQEKWGRQIRGLGPLLRYMVDTAMGGLNDVLVERMGKGRTIRIDVSGFRTAEFNISDARRDELLVRGRGAASDFFSAFEPEGYRNSGGYELTERAKAGLA